MKACFFANAPMDVINVVGFYQTDIRILKELGFDVTVSNKISNIPINSDLYFAYWASSGAKAVMVSKLARKPSVVIAAGSDVARNDPTGTGYDARPIWQKGIIRWCLKAADAIVADSKDVEKEARALGTKNLYMVYFGVDTNIYKPSTSPKEQNFVLVSHISKQNVDRKRMEDIIRAMKIVIEKYPKATFTFVGTQLEGYPIVKKLAEELELPNNIEFVESRGMPEGKKIEYMNRALAFVQPSLHEGFGLAMVEAMSCALPVIVTRQGATPEVAGEDAIYVPLKSPESIAKEMLSLLENEEKVKLVGSKLRQRVIDVFSYEQRKAELKKIIETVMK